MLIPESRFLLESDQYRVEFVVQYRAPQEDYWMNLTMTIDTPASTVHLPSIEIAMLSLEMERLSQYFEGYASQRTVGILKEREPFFPLQLGFYCQLLGGEVWPCDPANSEDLCSEATLRFMLRNVTDGSRSGGYVGAEGRIELSQIRSLVRYLQTLLLP